MPSIKDEKNPRATGRQLDDMVTALLESAFDKDPIVRETIQASLFDLGRKQSTLILSSCNEFLAKNSKLQTGHRVVILDSMEKIINETIDSLHNDLAVQIIERASAELTQSKDIVPDWQTSASSVIVAIGTRFCNDVMSELLKKFQPGQLPHFFVVQTLASLSVANVYGMVPFIKVCLGTMLPMLGMAKQDNLRWVYSTALARFSEAIVEYTANIDKAPDPDVTTQFFSAEIYSSWDILFTVWLTSREAKLRSVVIEALGRMSYILSPVKLQDCLPKLIPTLLSLYKKQHEPYNVTLGLYMILDAATQFDSTMLEPHLEQLFSVLFPLLCVHVDYNSQASVKNHNELLRCFSVLMKVFADKIIAFLLMRLEQANEKTRVGVLDLVRHLINSSGPHLEGKEDLLLSGLKPVLSDHNNKVKKSLASTIITMGHHRYLEREGGQAMIEFIVRQCCLQPDTGKPQQQRTAHVYGEPTNEELRTMCDNVLLLLSSTVQNMDAVLWPYLLELLMPDQYTDAAGCVCKAVSSIAQRKKNNKDEDYMIDFNVFADTPKPTEIIARLVILAGYPLHGNGRGQHVLGALQSMSTVLVGKADEMWEKVLPKLVKHLEDNKGEGWSQKNWEDLVLKFLSKTFDELDDENWTSQCGESFMKHIPLYTALPEEKSFLFKCIGVVVRKSNRKELVIKLVDTVFVAVNHGSQLEREGCAVSMGLSAASHLDLVLAKLEAVAKMDSKKSSGFLNFFKDSNEVEELKATLMLCYGYVTLYAPPELIQSRLEANILRTISPHFTQVKDRAVKQNLIRAVELIGQAMHVDHLKTSFPFSYRNTLLQHMQNYIKAESTTAVTSETRALAMSACATLVKLDPKLTGPELQDLVKLILFSVLPLPSEPAGSQTSEEHQEQEQLMGKTLKSLSEVLTELLIKDMTVKTFDLITQALVVWLKSSRESERVRTIDLLLNLVQLFHDKLSILGSGNFQSFGAVMSWLVPRCSDPNVVVRQTSFSCVEIMLLISAKYEGKGDSDQYISALSSLKEKVIKPDSTLMFSVINDLAKVFNKKIPPDQLSSFLEGLMDGLLDTQAFSSSGACVVINSLLKARGSELHSQVDKFYGLLYVRLSEIQNAQTKTGTLRAMRTLVSHHMFKAIGLLLDDPLPLSENTVEIWKTVGQDQQMSGCVIDQLLEILSRSLPYEELTESKSKDRPTRRAMHTPLAVTCALTELSKSDESQVPMMNNYPRLLAAMLIVTSSMAGTKPPKKIENKDDSKKTMFVSKDTKVLPEEIAVEGLRQVIVASRSDKFLAALDQDNVWASLKDEEKSCDGFGVLARHMVETQSEFIPKMINHLNPVLSGLYYPQRAMAASVFAELISHKCGGDSVLVDMLVQSLLGRLVDTDRSVRMLCIRGLGNIANAGKSQVQKYCTTVLSAMMSGMDDKDDCEDVVTLESMTGLSKIIAQVSDTDIQPILINVALRIRPCFENEKASIRAAAFTLFGDLSAFGEGPSKEPFLEQIHTNLVSILLHLNDKDADVKQACKKALKRLSSLLSAEVVHNILQNHLGSGSLHYGEFINFLSKAIIQDLPERINHYVMGAVLFFKSTSSEMRCNAAIFVGFILGNMSPERCVSVSKEHVCTALVSLLKDSESSVRMSAASAIGLLTNL